MTPLELFFDLVFVFAITQVTSLLSTDPSWGGLFHALLLLSMLWWSWSAYAWLTNTLDPDEGGVRLVMLAAIAAMLIMSLAAPRAFGSDGETFAVAYTAVRAFNLVLLAYASRGNRELATVVVRIFCSAVVVGALLVSAGFLRGAPRLTLWTVAAAVNYLGALVGHMSGWRVWPAHFVERFGQVIMIALGESIVAIGVGAKGLALDAGVIGAALLGITVVSCLWWSYFDWVIYVAETRLAEVSGSRRAALARDVYSYLHLPMVGGIVLFAFGLKAALPDVNRPLDTVPAFGLAGGIALYFLAHVGVRLRISGGLGRGRPLAALVLLALLPAVTHIPAVAAIALVAAVCACLIAYEFFRHRESRALIRRRRSALTWDELRASEGGGPVP